MPRFFTKKRAGSRGGALALSLIHILHIDEELMDELKNIKAPTEPAEIMLVVDAMTGQDAVNAASAFDEALDVTRCV